MVNGETRSVFREPDRSVLHVLREEFWVTTLTGLLDDQGRRALGWAFVETGAMHCGYCTPGMLAAATAL